MNVTVYRPAARVYKGLPDVDYPFHDKVIVVTNCGRICLGHKKINFSPVFAGQAWGIKEAHEDSWLVSFMDYDLGYFDLDTRGFGTDRESVWPESVTYVAVHCVNPCLRVGPA